MRAGICLVPEAMSCRVMRAGCQRGDLRASGGEPGGPR